MKRAALGVALTLALVACRLCDGEHREYAHNGRIVVVPSKA